MIIDIYAARDDTDLPIILCRDELRDADLYGAATTQNTLITGGAGYRRGGGRRQDEGRKEVEEESERL